MIIHKPVASSESELGFSGDPRNAGSVEVAVSGKSQ